MSAPEFVLKTTPPRIGRTAVQRVLLERAATEALDRTAVTVVAPAGFGKTTLLAQWRRVWLKRNALVAWLTVDPRDDPARFTLGVLHAMRAASAKPAFDILLSQYADGSQPHLEALTGLLREIVRLGTETILVIDDAERLPGSTFSESLQYLLRNAPQNFHVAIGSRLPLPLHTWELATKGSLACLEARELRLELSESIAILGSRFGQRLSVDDCARLHDLVDGWPLGLQLAAATIEREPDLADAIDVLSARHGDIERYFFELLLTRVPAKTVDLLVRVAILGHVNADLCEALTGCTAAKAYLAMLTAETPILAQTGLEDWVRVHPLARDFLMQRFERLPADEQRGLHVRASTWFAGHERFHEAACHALEAGDQALAHSYAARALWTLTVQGQLLEARDWLEQIPSDVVAGDVDLRLVGAWIMAIGEHNAKALETAQAVLHDPLMDTHRRFVGTRAAVTAVAYGDRLGLLPAILEGWRKFRPDASQDDPIQAVAYSNALAFAALHAGDTGQVRQIAGQLPSKVDKDSLRLPVAHRLVLIGLSHLWDGNASLAEAALRPALANAERIAGRRSMVACFHAAVVAAALVEQGELAAARAMLANRLDIIERVGAPDIILLAYRTLALVAHAEGEESRALDLHDALAALAMRRRLPRLALHAHAERVRIHALSGRIETADRFLWEIRALDDDFADEAFAVFRPLYELTGAIASTYASLAKDDTEESARQLQIADRLANALGRGRDIMSVKILRAIVAYRRKDSSAGPLLAEAMSLAAMGGCKRVLADTHPLAARIVGALEFSPAPARPLQIEVEDVGRIASRGGLLTGKEAEILGLLPSGLSNKRIARAMEISEETVKWHVKNLFFKLDANTRQHAVRRARLLGLLAG
ncbi:MAG: LuxR C-terminal-related transcriptional regulator [Luteimonas sp.]